MAAKKNKQDILDSQQSVQKAFQEEDYYWWSWYNQEIDSYYDCNCARCKSWAGHEWTYDDSVNVPGVRKVDIDSIPERRRNKRIDSILDNEADSKNTIENITDNKL